MQVNRRVSLNGLEIRAFHGVYEFERRQGGEYTVDAWVEELAEAQMADLELEDTLNYELLLELVQKELNRPTPLLESLANRILLRVQEVFPQATAAGIKIQKLNPPLDARVYSSSVEQTTRFDRA